MNDEELIQIAETRDYNIFLNLIKSDRFKNYDDKLLHYCYDITHRNNIVVTDPFTGEIVKILGGTDDFVQEIIEVESPKDILKNNKECLDKQEKQK